MLDILNRQVVPGDLVILADVSQPYFAIVTHMSKSGNIICGFSHYDLKRDYGKFNKTRSIIGPYRRFIIITDNIPDELKTDYLRIVNDASLIKRSNVEY